MANLIVMAERPVSDPETDPSMRRRTALSFALASPLLLAAGCSTGPADGQGGSTGASGEVEDGALPVTLEHAFGSTTVQSAPQRVVTIGWSDQDVVAVLGLVPAAAAKITWGGNAKGSTDWFDEQIRKNSSTNNSSGSAVERYDDSDGVPLDEIATFEPDLILGVNSGMTKAEYAKLSKIAPTVAYPDMPWTTPWRDSTTTIGAAVGRPDAAKDLVARTEETIERAKNDLEDLRGKTVAWGWIDPKDTSTLGLYGSGDLRPQMLREFGMKDAPLVAELSRAKKTFDLSLSAERAEELDADVFIFYLDEPKQLDRILASPLVSAIPAIRKKQYVASVDRTVAYAMSSPTPLSIEVAATKFMPKVATAAGGTPVTR